MKHIIAQFVPSKYRRKQWLIQSPIAIAFKQGVEALGTALDLPGTKTLYHYRMNDTALCKLESNTNLTIVRE